MSLSWVVGVDTKDSFVLKNNAAYTATPNNNRHTRKNCKGTTIFILLSDFPKVYYAKRPTTNPRIPKMIEQRATTGKARRFSGNVKAASPYVRRFNPP